MKATDYRTINMAQGWETIANNVAEQITQNGTPEIKYTRVKGTKEMYKAEVLIPHESESNLTDCNFIGKSLKKD